MDPRVEDALDRLSQLGDESLRHYRDELLDEICYLTGSELAYVAAMNLEEDILTMVGWSRGAMDSCGIMEQPIVYRLQETGMWGDAVRERDVVITNDYANSTRPTKRGYPEGHVHVTNHMNLPIFEDGRVVLVVGVGNKDGDYTREDAALIEELMNVVWDTFRARLWSATW